MTETTRHTASPADADGPAKITSDFDFLNGAYDVTVRRLKSRLTGSDEWDVSSATAVARTCFNGAVSLDEFHFPTIGYSGASVRLFDPETEEWTIYWVDSRTGRLEPPVVGSWRDGVGTMIGDDEHEGTPVLNRYRWSDATEDGGHWEQAFSVDGGETWETNMVMDLTRRAGEPPAARLPKVTDDFDFLDGRWTVAHRRRSRKSGSGTEWEEFSGIADAWTCFNGAISIDENDFPSLGIQGLSLRFFDSEARSWSTYWIDSRNGRLQPGMYGGFHDGLGELYGDDEHDGRPARFRFLWTGIGEGRPRWEQAFSTDDGETWELDWSMNFTRIEDTVA